MLNKLASVFGLTALFMLQSITALSDYAHTNMEQFAFLFGVDKGSPLIGTILDPKYFIAMIFMLVCLSAACFATKIIFGLCEIAAWLLDYGIKRMANLAQNFAKPK